MTKKLRNILISLFVTLPLLLAGFFLVGCGPDYSKISLVADQTTLQMKVGEQKEVNIKIEGYQKGFSNIVTTSKEGDGVFDATTQTISESEIKVIVTAKAGGEGKLTISTWESKKSCTVNIFVEQTSPSLSVRQDILFVTENSDFVPNANMFDFEGTTTNRELSFYYIGSDDSANLNEFSFGGFQDGKAIFRKGEDEIERDFVQIDKVRLVGDDPTLVAVFNGQETPLDMTEKFQLLTIYQPSISENGSASIFNVSDVFVLRALNVSILGGYLQSDGHVEQPDKEQTPGFKSVFEEVENLDGSVTQTVPPITIVPNRERFVQYILKLDMGTLDEDSPVDIKISKSNDDVVVDFVDFEEPNVENGNVKYIKISQNALRQTSTTLSLQIFYEFAKNVENQDVNFTCKFTINTEIAPSYITVNGLEQSEFVEPFALYSNNFGGYGWKEFYVDVISSFKSAPTYEGIYFTFLDENYAEILQLTTYNGTPVVPGRVYTDLERPFRVKGKDGIQPIEAKGIRIDVAMKGILKDTNIPYFEIPCSVKAGARSINIEERYEEGANFYVDYEVKDNIFDAQLYTDEPFETITTQYVPTKNDGETSSTAAKDCVDIIVGAQPCKKVGEKYYLNFTIRPKAVGVGKYNIILDNGVSLTVSFVCKNFLKKDKDKSPIVFNPNINPSVTAYPLSSSENDGFLDTLSLEILNPSTKNSVTFGSSATFEIVANIDNSKLEPIQDDYNYITVSRVANVFTITTRGNGDTKITFALQGDRLVEGDFLIDKGNPTIVDLVVYVSSYSLAEEFFLANGANHAYSSNVYCGSTTIPESEKRVQFSAVANFDGSNNFFQNQLKESYLQTIYENAYSIPGNQDEENADDIQYFFDITNQNFNDMFSRQLVHETFRGNENRFLTISLSNSSGSTLTSTILEATLTRYLNGVAGTPREIQLVFRNGIMLWLDTEREYEYETLDSTGRIRYALKIKNLNYSVAGFGTFNFDTLEYNNTFSSESTIIFSAQIEQRKKPQRFDAKVSIIRYAAVERISLSSGTENIDFSSKKLTETISVYTYPLSSTNNDIQVQFAPTGEVAYQDLVQWTIDYSNAANGVFTISLSCKEFCENDDLHGGISIEEIETALTGDLYIFPADWGSSYTSLIGGNIPIKLSLQFHNGSRNNPYILEDAEDIAEINFDRSTLKSHYELRTAISLETTTLTTPIGILDGEVVGFSGSITGTTAQAGITNVFVTNSNLSTTVDGKLYGGLFAQINDDAILENFTVSGIVNLDAVNAQEARIGLLAAQNRGQLLNVGANLDASSISGSAENLYFGGLVGLNYGQITQDLRYYDGTAYYYHQFGEYVDETAENGDDGKGKFVPGVGYVKKFKAAILDDDILGKYVEIGENRIRLDKDNFAIDENGIRIKFAEDGNLLLSNHDFEGQSSRNMAFFNGETTIDISGIIFAGGVVGANSGVIERIMPTKETFQMYGYSNYSAYARICIVGAPTNVALGGIAGLVSYNNANQNFSMPEGKTGGESGNILENLLVGGKLSTLTLPDTTEDYVGGLVGYATTADAAQVSILSNISRTFVKGIHYVGGLVGYEFFSEEFNSETRTVTYGLKDETTDQRNVFEAVDDGENSFAASSIIRVGAQELDENVLTYMIGNSDNGREYVSEELSGDALDEALSNLFETSTYVTRDQTSISADINLQMNSGSSITYYGDFLVVERNVEGSILTFKILQAVKFTQKTISLEIEDKGFKMASDKEIEGLPDVVFMYYFHVDSDLAGNLGAAAQAEIESLNYVTRAMTDFYPFELTNPEVSISSVVGDAIDIDMNGNITVNGQGIAEVTLSSILNTNVRKVFYIYVVNHFNKNISSSIFFVQNDQLNKDVPVSNTALTIYGDSYVNIYMEPNYALSNATNANGERFSISPDGILTYRNVSYVLSKSAELSPDINFVGEEASKFSSYDIVGQKIVFRKEKAPTSDALDSYNLVPVLSVKITINGKEYVFVKKLELNGNAGKLNLAYSETATAIRLEYDKLSMQTNQELNGNIFVESTNKAGTEMIFYQISKLDDPDVVLQSRVPETINFANDEAYLKYINNYAQNDKEFDLFALTFKRIAGTNNFTFNLQINKDSDQFKNRFKEPISGQYRFSFSPNFNSESPRLVKDSFILTLDNAELDYVSAINYSNFSNLSTPNEIVEPGTKGFLEISLNPVEAVFDRFTISNNAINDNAGAGKATFMFAYRTQTGYEELAGFGSFESGHMLTFTYQEMIEKLNALKEANQIVSGYVGKIYFTYFVASSNVADNVDMAFDVVVTPFGEGGPQNTTINLKTKLGSYARFVMENKEIVDDGYYVARGLSYDLALETFGFEESQVGLRVGGTGDFVPLSALSAGRDFGNFSIRGQNGRYVLTITSANLEYNGQNAFEIEIETRASKVLNQVTVENSNVLKLYVMEFVLNYQYISGENEDIVEGMRGGSVNIAVGNPFTPRLSIWDFLEYDSSNNNIVSKVTNFVEEMTTNVQWTAVFQGQSTILRDYQTIQNDFYHIDGLTVTPIKTYHDGDEIYHFEMLGYYRIANGEYRLARSAEGANTIFTQFVFDVHDQSTQDSPIPVYDYDELMEKLDETNGDGWFILMNNIVIPNAETTSQNETENFQPISANFLGIDGNGYAFVLSGLYDFDGANAGVFGTIRETTLLQNITVRLNGAVTFRMHQGAFNVGLLAAENQGVITNAQTEASSGAAFSVTSTVTASDAIVAGLVAQNSGFITNSRTTVDIVAPYNLSGFVGTNTGHIASSYFRGASLENRATTTAERTAGFVLDNSGEIFTSYVSGDMTKDNLKNQGEQYYHGADASTRPANTITSGNNVSGFAYSNNGTIADCYSNIYLYYNRTGAGFVFENSSDISRCFSTSVLGSRSVESFGFAQQNSVVDENQERQGGTIEDCYFLQHRHSGSDDTKPDINFSIKNLDDDENADIMALDFDSFKFSYNSQTGELELPEKVNGRTPFENFLVTYGRNTNSVWFYNGEVSADDNFNGTFFNTERLELVAPNIKASSSRDLLRVSTVVDSETGAEYSHYEYAYHAGTPALGSDKNPVLISNAEEFEKFFKTEADSSKNNFSHYRLVSDINFDDASENSTLYDINFMGYLEGNFMSVEGISLQSSRQKSFAGLFAKIGGERDALGVLMNFTYAPSVVSFVNTEVVGALAGKLDGGTLVNIHLISDNAQDGVVDGKNIVGGLLGLAVGDFEISNVSSEFGAISRTQAFTGNDFNENSNNFASNSFAGSIAGVLSGRGKIKQIVSNSILTIMGSKIGLLFGFVDEQVRAQNISLEVNAEDILNGYEYAGFVAGETKGTFKDVSVSGDGDFAGFRKIPYTPVAVGGFAGLVSGGNLQNISVEQNIVTSSISSSTGISYIGGIAGRILGGAQLSGITVTANIVGFMYVGGVAGQISTEGTLVRFQDMDVDVDLSVLGRMIEQVGVGGLAGEIDANTPVWVNVSAERTPETTSTLSELTTLQQNIADIERMLELPELIKNAGADKGTLKEELETSISAVNDICKNNYGEKENVVKLSENGEAFEYETGGQAKLTAVCTKIQSEIATKLQTLQETFNTFDVGVHVNIYLYQADEGLQIDVGAIFGRNTGTTPSVSDTFSYLHGITQSSGQNNGNDIVIEDLSQDDPKENTSSISVVTDAVTGQAKLSNVATNSAIQSAKTSIVPVISKNGTNSFSTCRLSVRQSITVKENKENFLHEVGVSICGELFADGN